MKRRKVPTEAVTLNCPVKQMSRVKHVFTTEYQMGLVERFTLDSWHPVMVPVHLCVMRTKNGHLHVFVWE